jgi:hypothetical protein
VNGFLWTLLIVAVVAETLLLLVAWQIWPQTASERQAGWRRTIAVLTPFAWQCLAGRVPLPRVDFCDRDSVSRSDTYGWA